VTRVPLIRVTAMPADTNPYGGVFGGWLMGQMALAAGSLASRHSRGKAVVVFFGFTQCRVGQVPVFGVASSAGKSHLATVGRQAAGAQGQHQFRRGRSGNRHQYACFGHSALRLQKMRGIVTHPLENLVQHEASLLVFDRHHGMNNQAAQDGRHRNTQHCGDRPVATGRQVGSGKHSP